MENFVDLGITPGWVIGWSVVGGFLILGGLLILLPYLRYRKAKYRYNVAKAEGETAYGRDRHEFEEKYRKSHEGEDPPYYLGPRRDQYPGGGHVPELEDYDGWFFFGIVLAGLAALALIIQLFMMIPFQYKYLAQYEVAGVVESAQGTIDTGSKYVTSEFVVKLDSTNIPLYTNDVRIQDLVGQDVTLICGAAWVDFGRAADQWSCNIRAAAYTEK